MAISAALSFVAELNAVGGDLVLGMCDYFESIAAPDGGLPFVHPNIQDYPRAPWWQIPDVYQGHLVPTGSVAGLLHAAEVDHPWLARATGFCWRKLDETTETASYEALAGIRFLDHTSDRGRAEAAAERLGRMVRAGNHVALSDSDNLSLEGFTETEVFFPHDYASSSDSLARQWFSDEEFEASLDVLVDAQRGDGSWPVRWPSWTPVTAFEWGGWLTIDALRILTSYDRIE